MTDLSYHVENQNRSGKNELLLSITSLLKRKLTKEYLLSQSRALEPFLKAPGDVSYDRVLIPADRSFEVLKTLGSTGRVFFRGKKVVIDPFSSFALQLKGERLSPEKGEFTAFLSLNETSSGIDTCEFIFDADPAWVIQHGMIRRVEPWVKEALSGKFCLVGASLHKFLDKIDEELKIDWKGDFASLVIEPLPILSLADRHGGFADLWFDYASFGKVAAHDPTKSSFRNLVAEKGWEKDLLETDFIKKIVDHSHFYCPLNKVAKSLTFLLELGWSVFDAEGRRVVRQKAFDFDAEITDQNIVIKAKVHYDEHLVDLKDLVGAFNRREHFVQLSPKTVALIDPIEFQEQWGELTDQEITTEGISLKKNQLGLLHSLTEKIPLKEELRQKISRMLVCEPQLSAEVGKNFRGTLFPYQTQGLQWLKFLDEGDFGGLLADEMGLGKTVQVLAFFSLLVAVKPILIVVPTSLLFNWQREIEKFLPSFTVYRHEGKERLRNSEELGRSQVILTSYALLRIDAPLFQSLEYEVIVLDEAQSIKNPQSQVAQICFTLSGRIRLAITGTPIENRLEDLWSIFHFLQPDLLGEKQDFQSQIQAAGYSAHYLSKIKAKIRPFLLRRKKDQVSLELPEKLEQTVYVEMTDLQREVYDRWLQNTKQGVLKKVSLDGIASHRMEILEAILRLRQICAHPWLVQECQEEDPQNSSAKFQRLLSELQEVVQEKQKVLIYSQFTSMLKLIQKQIQELGYKHVYLDGSTKDREGIVKQFQDDGETCVFLISLKAGGVGLNLTAADYVFLYDPWWNDAAERQAIDRAHRFGKVGTVIARRYVTALSIEEKIMALKEHKSALSQNLLESDEGYVPTSMEDLLALLQ